MRAALASHFANMCQNHSGLLSIACLFLLMTAAPIALIALTAPALSALRAFGFMISSRACAWPAVAAARALVGMIGSCCAPLDYNEHRPVKLTDTQST